jgi:hypothetical protein
MIAAACISMSACSSVPDNVISLSSDTYRITSRMSFNNLASSQKMAAIEAENFCSSLRRDVQVLSMTRESDFMPFDITFKCVDPAEHALPVFIKTPAPLILKNLHYLL